MSEKLPEIPEEPILEAEHELLLDASERSQLAPQILYTEEQAQTEAHVLQEKMSKEEVATRAEAEVLLDRDAFEKKLIRDADRRNDARPLWKKLFGMGTISPTGIAKTYAEQMDEEIQRLVASGKFLNTTEAVEYLNHQGLFVSSPKELELTSNELAREGKLLGGCIGGATFVDLKDDGSAVFKPHKNYKNPARSEFINRERGAYLIDRFLGFNFVPPTVVRELGGQLGSLQEFIADAKTAAEVMGDEIPDMEKIKLHLFDTIIMNTDRHKGNWLVKDKKIYAIDHGYALDIGNITDSFTRNLDEVVSVPPELNEGLRRFMGWPEGQALLQEELVELFGDERASVLMKRIGIFLSAIDEQQNFSREKFKKGLKSL